jgi:PhnB protein
MKSEAATMDQMALHPYINLSFNGQCEDAFRHYERCLNGKVTFMLKYADSPMAKDAPAEWGVKIVHATLEIGTTRIQGSDPPPGGYEAPKGFAISLKPEFGDAETLFTALAEGGTVTLPLQQTFWARAFGMVTDRFGVPWIINAGDPSEDR